MGVRFKQATALLLGASALFLASPAMATTITLGVLTPGVGTGGGGYIGTALNPGDSIFFDLAETLNVGGGTNSAPATGGTGIVIKLTDLTAKFYRLSPDTLVGQLLDGESKVFDNLLAGSYRIDVTGSSANGLGGAYSLNLIAQPAAAPGPAGLLFVVGGAAVMAMRRRAQKAKSGGQNARLALA